MNARNSMCCMLVICRIVVNAREGVHGTKRRLWHVDGGGCWAGAEEVTERYQLTLPCNPNSNRLKCYEHVCTGMPLSARACMSNMVHVEGGFRLDYRGRSNSRAHQCCLSSAQHAC